MNKWFKSGSPWIWLSAGGVSLSLISVLGLLWLIASRGLSYFWPAQVHQFELLDKHGKASTVIGEIYDRESIPSRQLSHLALNLDPAQETVERLLVKTGNRELVSLDFRWILVPEITKQSTPEKLVVIERRTNGNFYGYIDDIILEGQSVNEEQLPALLDRVLDIQDDIETLQKVDIGAINYQLERLRLRERKYKLEDNFTPENASKIASEVAALESGYQILEKNLLALRDKTSRDQLKMRAMDGQIVTISFADIFERQFIGMGFNAGTFIFFIVLTLVLGGLIYYFHKKGSRLGHIITVSLTVLIIGFSSFAMIVVRSNANPPLDENNPETPTSLKSYLGREQYGDWPLIYGGFWNSPGKQTDIQQETGEKYFKSYSVVNKGVKKTFQSQFEADAYISSTKNTSLKVEEEYIVTGKRYKQVLPKNMDNQFTYFPRMFDKRPGKIRGYKFWSGYDGSSGVRALNAHKGQNDNFIPTTADNTTYFANYQMGWMYFRYFLWNFAGRQNDVQGHNYHYTGDGMMYKGSLTRGNWLSGVNFIDKERVGTQNNLPTTQSMNEAYNTYFYLPLILGLIGLVFQIVRAPKDAFSTFLLFFFTGLAIIIYLNQRPEEPRERDYAFAASFYAFAIWIGLGILALYRWAKSMDMAQFKKGALITLGVGALFFVREIITEDNHAFSFSILFMGIIAVAITGLLMVMYKSMKNDKSLAIIITLLGLSAPIIMGVQNWDDHDRSGRYFARDIAKNYLNSCGENAILFCFGDNDTFPLWYAQEVEGIRTDMKVMNYSLLSSDWHYSQLKRKTYEAEAVNSLLTEPEYRAGTRDIIRFQASNKSVSAKQFIQYLKSGRDLNPNDSRFGYSRVPFNKIYVDVDKEACIRNGLVREDQKHLIVNRVEWTLSGGYISRADLAMIDILASYQWERPICFTSRGIQGANKGLGKYLQQEGMTATFVPILNPGNHKDKMYSLLMGEDVDFTGDNKGDGFSWGGVEKEGVFVDYYTQRMIRSARMHYMQLAESFVNSGLTYKNQAGADTTGELAKKSEEYISKAINILDKAHEVFPLHRAKVDELSDYLALMYFRADDTAKGNLHTNNLAKLYSENIDYFAAQNEDYIIEMIQEIGGFIKHFEQLGQGSSNPKYLLKNYNPEGYRLLADKIKLAAKKHNEIEEKNKMVSEVMDEKIETFDDYIKKPYKRKRKGNGMRFK